MFPNRYPAICQNPTCKCPVAIGQGHTQKINNNWVVWCNNCVPQQKTAVRRELTADGSIFMPFEQVNTDLLRSLAGAHWNPTDKCWTVSLKMGDRSRLLEIADRIGLAVAPELRTVEVTEQANNAMMAGLYPYQVEGVNFLGLRDKALLCDDMGLGKTVQSLMSIKPNGATLVICRAGLKYNWEDEVHKWRSDLTPIVINGSGNFQWPQENEVVIINPRIIPDTLNTPKKNVGEPMPRYWDRLRVWREKLKKDNPQAANVALIVDEAHDYKSNTAARSRKIKELVKLTKKTIGLTGSPLENRPEDLYGVLDNLGMAQTVFRNLDHFEELMGAIKESVWTGRGYVNKVTWGKPQPIVPELLRRVMLRRLRKEVLPDLPSKTYTNVVVGDIDAKLQKALDEMWEEWGTAISIGGDLPPFEKFSEIREKLAQSRIPAMLEFVEDAEEQDVPLVVFSAHLSPLDQLLGRPGWAVITGCCPPQKRQEIVRAFQAGKLKGLGVSIEAGGVGINLTHAYRALFVDLDWRPASNWQAEDRICRIGQISNKVEILRMVSKHPLDLHLHNLLVEKIDTIIKSIDSMIVGYKGQASSGESNAEFEARMERVLQQQKEERLAQDKTTAKAKVGNIHTREKTRVKQQLLPLTPERTAAVRESFKYMLSVCDGAVTLDGVGFNKPDAVVAHWLLTAGLETDLELEAGQCILTRYHRQLKEKYPILFK